MKGTGAKRNVCPGSCVSTGAKFPVAPVESAPMPWTRAAHPYSSAQVDSVYTQPFLSLQGRLIEYQLRLG